jgi:hypothetical protein
MNKYEFKMELRRKIIGKRKEKNKNFQNGWRN